MKPFIFIYHEKESNGYYIPSDKGKGWYKVIFFEHSAIIFPTAIKKKDSKRIWIQAVNPGEGVWPHELIQILGDAIDATPSVD